MQYLFSLLFVILLPNIALANKPKDLGSRLIATTGMVIILAVVAGLIRLWKSGHKKLTITILSLIGLWFVGSIVYDEMHKHTQPPSAIRLDVEDPFKARQAPPVSSEPSRDAYLKMLDSYISDGTPAVRLQTIADPAFVTFLNLKDKNTGRLIRDIAEEADRKQDAATMSDVYKAFYKWRQQR